MVLERLAGACCAILLMTGSVFSWAAADARLTVRELYDCAIHQHEMLTAYHLYASDPKDRTLNADFQAARQLSTSCAVRAGDALAAAGLSAQAAEVRSLKDSLAQNAQYNSDSIAKSGVPENAVLAEMVMHELKLVSTLTQSAKDLQVSAKLKEVAEARQARELAILIMYADARYVERTTEVYHRDDSAEPTIDQLGMNFYSGLSKLRASKRLTAEQKKMLDNVNTRYRFINGSLNNYTQDAVPFTVNRHARSMVTLLNQVANGLDGIK
ncbi:MAG TPA: hypothetical protein DF427_06090 [Moraxellaceae bacterium]|nr:hypothetical protein [Moraxellaceae bacterium]